jgi:hypothetical protein
MCVELLDPGVAKRLEQGWVKVWGQRREARRTGVLERLADEALIAPRAVKQRRPGLDLAHPRGCLTHALP